MEIIKYIVEHWVEIAQAILAVSGAASVIVKITPTLKDDNIVLPIVKFIGKWIAMNKTVKDSDRPKS